jgi:hypothetical protein
LPALVRANETPDDSIGAPSKRKRSNQSAFVWNALGQDLPGASCSWQPESRPAIAFTELHDNVFLKSAAGAFSGSVTSVAIDGVLANVVSSVPKEFAAVTNEVLLAGWNQAPQHIIANTPFTQLAEGRFYQIWNQAPRYFITHTPFTQVVFDAHIYQAWNRAQIVRVATTPCTQFMEPQINLLGTLEACSWHAVCFGGVHQGLAQSLSNANSLTSMYEASDWCSVDAFLFSNSFLSGLLTEAHPVIEAHFGAGTKVSLEIVHEPEAPGHEEIFGLIHTKLEPEDALRHLDSFDANWWLSAVTKARGKLNFSLRYD